MADHGSHLGPSYSKSEASQNLENSAGNKAHVASRNLKLPHFLFHERNFDDFSTPSFEPPTPPVQSTVQGFVPERRYGQEIDTVTKGYAGYAQADLFIEPTAPLTQQDIDQFYPALKLENRRKSSFSAANLSIGIEEKSANSSESVNSYGLSHSLTHLPSNSHTAPNLLNMAENAGPITKQFSFQTLGDVFRRSHTPISSHEPLNVSDFEIHMMSPGSL